jgi:hypothetical protein
MLARKIPIIRGGARLGRRHGVDSRPALRRAPGGLEGQPRFRIRGTEDVAPGEADERRLGGLERECQEQQPDRDLPDPLEDPDDPIPQVAEDVGDEHGVELDAHA